MTADIQFTEGDWDHMIAKLEQAGQILRSARTAQQDAYEHARVIALDVIHIGLTEAEAARILGVNRMTVRKWRGKR